MFTPAVDGAGVREKLGLDGKIVVGFAGHHNSNNTWHGTKHLALAIAAKEIAAHRAGSPATPRQRFAAIANCGFPEATQNATALAICATFARQAGFGWAGDLALGGGEGLVHGVELARLGGRARHAVAALDLAGDALSAGAPIPEAARDLLARPAIPGWLYRGVGGLGWRLQARRFGMASSLGRRPYAP